MASAPREIELKLEVDPRDLGRIRRRLTQLSVTKPVARTLVSTYFDTATWALYRKHVSFRVRRIGRHYVQTIKSGAGGPTAGLYDRGEWEHSIRGPQPELSRTADTPLGPLLRKGLAASLRPVFKTRIHRTEYRLVNSAAVITADVDHGTVRARSRQCGVCELELELSRGAPAALFKVAAVLGEVAPMHLSVNTKHDRGYELLTRKGGTANASADSVLAPATATAGGAFQTIARACLQQIVANAKAVRAHDSDALHRMRVALRRLRAAIAVFSEVVRDKQSEKIKSELHWIEGALGPARDLDVFIADVAGPLHARHSHNRGLKRAYRNLKQRRALLYTQVDASLQSERFRHLELELARWIEAGLWVTTQADSVRRRRNQPVKRLAAKAIARRRKKLRKAGSRLAELSTRDRHKLRIRVKKLRYTVEFFSALFPSRKCAKRCRDSLSALVDLQDSLGALNDLVKQRVLSAQGTGATTRPESVLMVAKSTPKLLAASEGLPSQSARRVHLLRRAERAFKRFCDVKPFWK